MLLFNNKTPKKINFNGKHVAKVIFNNVVVWLEKVLTKITGYPITLTNSTGDDLVDYKIYGNSVKNGTPTPDNPIEVESVGDKTNNVFNTNLITSSLVQKNNDGITIENGYDVPVIEFARICQPNTTYYIHAEKEYSQTRKNATGRISNMGYLGTLLEYSKTDATFTTGDVVSGILYFYGFPEGTVRFLNLYIGTEPYTQYEPYGYKIPVKVNNITTNIYLNEPLRKIGNYADYIDYENNQIVRNIIKKALNVNLVKYGERANVYGFRMNGFAHDGKLDGTYNMLNICDSFKTISGGSVASNNTESLALRQGSLYLFLDKSRISSFDATEASQYVNSLEAYVYYILDEPEYETIELPTIATDKGTNIIEVDTSIQPSNTEVKYYAKEV